MIKSSIIARIFLGSRDDYPQLQAESPEIGLFFDQDERQLFLAYTTDDGDIHSDPLARAAQGFLTKDGIGAISQRADFKYGGAPAFDSPTTLKINCNDRYMARLDELGISVLGKTVVLFERRTEGSVTSPFVLYGGVIESITYGETILSISVVPSSDDMYGFNLQEDGYVAVFGDTKYAKYSYHGEKEYLMRIGAITTERVGGTGNEWPVLVWQRDTRDPDLQDIPWNVQKFLIEIPPGVTVTRPTLDALLRDENKPLFMEANTSSEISAVSTIELFTPEWGGNYIAVTAKTFIDMREFASTISLFSGNNLYRADVWPTEIIEQDESYHVINDKLAKLNLSAQYKQVTADDTRSLARDLYVNGIYVIDGDINSLFALYTLPAKSMKLLTERNDNGFISSSWGDAERRYGPNLSRYYRALSMAYKYVGNGYKLYSKPTSGHTYRPEQADIINPHYAFIPDDREAVYFLGSNIPQGSQGNGTGTPFILAPTIIELPSLSEDLRGINAKVFLHTRMTIDCGPTAGNINREVIWGVFDGHGNYVQTAITGEYPTYQSGALYHSYNNLLTIRDNRFITGEYSENFFIKAQNPNPPSISGIDGQHVNGYTRFSLDGIDFETDTKKELVITCPLRAYHGDDRQSGGTGLIYALISLRAKYIGIVAMININIEDGIMLRSSGRLFGGHNTPAGGSVWDNRRAASEQIKNPADVIEHILRQYERLASLDTRNRYSRAPLIIDTGSFDNALSDTNKKMVSRCIDSDSYSVNVINSLLRDYYLAVRTQYITNGRTVRGLQYLKNRRDRIVVDRKDLVAGFEVVISQVSYKDIYCEPIIKYGYVSGMGYTQEMAVTNINKSEWRPEYTRGLDDGVRDPVPEPIVINGLEWMTVDIDIVPGNQNARFIAADGQYSTLYDRRPSQEDLAGYIDDGWRIPTIDDINSLISALPLDSQNRPDARPIMSASWIGGSNELGLDFIPVGVGRHDYLATRDNRVRAGTEGVWWLAEPQTGVYRQYARFKISDNTISVVMTEFDYENRPDGSGYYAWMEDLFAVRLVRDARPPEIVEPLKNEAKALWDHCHGIFLKYGAFADMPNDLAEQPWIGDYGEDFGYQSKSYKQALARMYEILEWMQNSRTTIKVPWIVGYAWDIGDIIYMSVPQHKDGAECRCVIESVTKTYYGNTPNVIANLVILDSKEGDTLDFDIIDEGGNRDIIIDESADRDILISETGGV